MSVTLGTMFDRSLLDRMVEERFVVRREHPRAPLAILNYTERCQYERGAWNAVTLQCRGLIHDTRTEEVVARPFRKFFNWGQSGAPESVALDAPATVTDKLDGSLGILYPALDGWAIATRGAFESDQAIHATAVLRARFPDFAPPAGLTLLFEVVYPENRIVVDYRDTDDLFLLGAVDIATGRSVAPGAVAWPGERAVTYGYASLAEALAAPARPNAEGLVVHLTDSDERVKLKQEDYVALHRIVTGLNERTVWEHLSDGKPLADLLTPLPDEFHDWTRAVAAVLIDRVERDCAEIERAYAATLTMMRDGFTRKDFALEAVKHPLKWALFAKRDGKDYRPDVWKNARPEANRAPRATHTEDNA